MDGMKRMVIGRYWNKMGGLFVWSIEKGFLNGDVC